MKNMIFLFAFAFLLGCSKDEKIQEKQLPVTVENLEGKWTAIAYKEHSGSDFGPYKPFEEEEKYIITFNSDLTFLNASNDQCNGIFQINPDNKIILFFENSCFVESENWSIQSLSETTMVVKEFNEFEGFIIKYKR